MDLDFMAKYTPMYVAAAGLTLRIAIWGILFSLAAGLACSLIQYHKIPVLKRLTSAYIELSRNTPLLVQLKTGKVDIILANFTVTEERAQSVDFALPYMKVALGVVSPDTALITDVSQLEGKTLIVAKGTTAETYFTEKHPEVNLLKFDQYTETYNALLDGRGDAFSTDNTEVLAWALQNEGFTVGVESLGDLDTIAPAVQKGNTELLDWLNDEIKALGEENFFHKDYEETLAPVYGDAVDPDSLVVEGGVVE